MKYETSNKNTFICRINAIENMLENSFGISAWHLYIFVQLIETDIKTILNEKKSINLCHRNH